MWEAGKKRKEDTYYCYLWRFIYSLSTFSKWFFLIRMFVITTAMRTILASNWHKQLFVSHIWMNILHVDNSFVIVVNIFIYNWNAVWSLNILCDFEDVEAVYLLFLTHGMMRAENKEDWKASI